MQNTPSATLHTTNYLLTLFYKLYHDVKGMKNPTSHHKLMKKIAFSYSNVQVLKSIFIVTFMFHLLIFIKLS